MYKSSKFGGWVGMAGGGGHILKLPTASPSHQPQFTPCNQRSDVFDMCKE